MIRAHAFIDRARERGYDFYAGVPCSFLTPFINRVIDDEALTYISAANEGDAVAAAAGQALAGKRAVAMMQNSGLGNAVSPLTSLTWVFRLPVLLIVTWRGAPDVDDEPQHALMGDITPAMLDTMDIPWATFPDSEDDLDGVLQQAEEHFEATGRAFALVMKKGTVEPGTLHNTRAPGHSRRPTTYRPAPRPTGHVAPTRGQALRRLVSATPEHDTVLIATTGYTGRELYAIADRPNHLYMAGSMGCAPMLALGLALARPDLRVVVIDGDGAALMRLGAMATLAAYGPTNLVHLLLDNGMHESTGGQATVSAGLSFAAIAAGCGYQTLYEGHDLHVIDQALAGSHAGPAFAHLRITPGIPRQGLPRPADSPEQLRARFMRHIGAAGA